jgi:hypothetical protein
MILHITYETKKIDYIIKTNIMNIINKNFYITLLNNKKSMKRIKIHIKNQ